MKDVAIRIRIKSSKHTLVDMRKQKLGIDVNIGNKTQHTTYTTASILKAKYTFDYHPPLIWWVYFLLWKGGISANFTYCQHLAYILSGKFDNSSGDLTILLGKINL